MCEKHARQCFVLEGFAQVTSHSSVFTFCFFFSMTVLKMGIISQFVLTWVQILVIVFFFFLRNIRNTVLQACNFFISCSVDANLVAEWWWTIWFDILVAFSQLLNLNSCCKIRASKCLQRAIALYRHKMFNLFPLFCTRVFWGKYVQTLDNMCDRNQGFFFFLATCAISFRIMTPYFTMWVNKYSTKRTPSIWFLLDLSALFITPGRIRSKGNPENQAQCDCSFFFLSPPCNESQI